MIPYNYGFSAHLSILEIMIKIIDFQVRLFDNLHYDFKTGMQSVIGWKQNLLATVDIKTMVVLITDYLLYG